MTIRSEHLFDVAKRMIENDCEARETAEAIALAQVAATLDVADCLDVVGAYLERIAHGPVVHS